MLKYLYKQSVVCGVLLGAWMPVFAQPAGTLYDPEPPADSAYVRVVTANHEERFDVHVDGKVRVKNLKAGSASEYMVLGACRTFPLLFGRDSLDNCGIPPELDYPR